MEYKNLFLGILFSLGLFALKCGVGLYHVTRNCPRNASKVTIWLIFSSAYLLLFGVVHQFLIHVNLLDHIQAFQAFLKHGMTLHFGMALLMLVWGISLLKQRHSAPNDWAWIVMLAPCPVCLTVILLSISFTLMVFPKTGVTSAAGLFGFFMALSLISTMAMREIEKRSAASPEAILGVLMIAAAIYFSLSVIVLPHVRDLDKIYRLGLHAKGETVSNNLPMLSGWCLGALIFIIGFLRKHRMIRGTRQWISPPS